MAGVPPNGSSDSVPSVWLNDQAALPGNVVQALERLGRLSLRQQSMASLLRTVADLAKRVMPDHPETSVSLLANDRSFTVEATGQLAQDMDEAQYGHGDGPCVYTARTRQVSEIPDARTETRWPDYARFAVEHGNLSALSVPLPIDDEQLSGALNVYARTAHAFTEESRLTAARFAPYAAVAAGNMHAYQSVKKQAENLEVALRSREIIDEAKGIVMERYKLTGDQAFQLLVRVSSHTNTKLRDVADRLVFSGELQLPRDSGQ